MSGFPAQGKAVLDFSSLRERGISEVGGGVCFSLTTEVGEAFFEVEGRHSGGGLGGCLPGGWG